MSLGQSKKLKVLLGSFGVILLMITTNKKQPLGIRNNNAGNIRATGNWQEWQGAIDSNQGFIVFNEPENGLRAMARVLRTYRDIYNLSTITQIISRWAPPNENDTQSYINSAASITGLSPVEPLTANDYPLLMAAIVRHENGQQPYSNEQLQIGFERGFT